MPTDKAIIRQISAAVIVPLLDDNATPKFTDGTTPINALGTAIPFDYISQAGPEWPAPDGAGTQEFVETVAANGVTVQYTKITAKVDGATGNVKEGGAGSGAGHKLKFTILEWGKTLATTIPPLQGKLVICAIPIGENVTSSEDGWYYLLGKLSSAITYDATGETVVSVAIEVTGASATATAAGELLLDWAPAAITPVGHDTPVTPVPLVAGDVDALLTGVIIVK